VDPAAEMARVQVSIFHVEEWQLNRQ
jgi:hypothetical protein